MNAEFDKFAQNYTKDLDHNLSLTGENSTFWARYKAKKLHKWLPFYFQGIPKNILDFGCGTGVMTHEVQKLFQKSKIYGVDPSKESITIAQKQCPTINFNTSNDDLTLFKTNEFDVIFCAGVFHHIPLNQHKHYTQELYRILKKDGVLIMFELNPFNPGTTYIFNRNPIDHNAHMLKPTYGKNLFSKFGKTTCLFYGFFPHFLRFLRPLEPYITKIPLGGLYAIILKKS